MKRIVAVLVLAIPLAMALCMPVMSSTLLRCKAKDAVSLGDDGVLSRGAVSATNRLVDSWIIDLSTGMVRITDGTRELGPVQWTVVRKGNKSNDTVLVRLPDLCCGGKSSLNSEGAKRFTRLDLANAATDSIRIRHWEGMKNILFQKNSLSTFATGTCRPIH